MKNLAFIFLMFSPSFGFGQDSDSNDFTISFNEKSKDYFLNGRIKHTDVTVESGDSDLRIGIYWKCSVKRDPQVGTYFIFSNRTHFLNGLTCENGVLTLETSASNKGCKWKVHRISNRKYKFECLGGCLNKWLVSTTSKVFLSSDERSATVFNVSTDFFEKYSIPKVWAVIVGINDYSDDINQHGTSDLTFCIKDAEGIYSFLKSPQGGAVSDKRMRLLRNAKKDEILSTCESLFKQADENDLIIFYFSGHGAENLFVTQDDVLMHSQLKKSIYNSKANKKLCIADACHSGSWDKKAKFEERSRLNSNETVDLFYQSLGQSGEGIALFMASQANEYSIESSEFAKGVFTHFLIEGLKGTADSDGNRIITINELYLFVRSKVSAWSAANGNSQHPELKGKFDLGMTVGIRSN